MWVGREGIEAMEKIAGPRRPPDHTYLRARLCQEPAEPAFQTLADRIEAAGWRGKRWPQPCLRLPWRTIKTRIANAETEAAIRRARESVGEHRRKKPAPAGAGTDPPSFI